MHSTNSRVSPSKESPQCEETSDSFLESPQTVPEQIATPAPIPKPSYASLVDSDAGSQLRFIPAEEVDGKRCPQIAPEDVAEEVDYWNNAVLCAVLGSNPPFEVIKGFIKRIWASYNIDQILLVKRGLFLVRFVNLSDKQAIENRGVFFFDSKPFIVKGWNPEMDLQTEAIKTLALWVRFPDLDLKYWGMESLSKLGSVLGIPFKIDQFEKRMLSLRGPFVD